MGVRDVAVAPSGGAPAGADELLAALVEALPVGVLLQDEGRRVRLVNSAFIRLVGISVRPAELVGAVFDAAAPHVRDVMGGFAPAGGPAAAAIEVRTPAGRVVRRDHQPVRVGGRTAGQLWLLQDVTDQAAARRGVAEQERLTAELALLRSDFVATVSHELRTPLTSIVGLSTLLLDGPAELGPEQAACLQAIDRSADRLLRLADDLTLLAGLQAGSLPRQDEPVDPAALAGERSGDWQRSAAEAGVTLRLDSAAGGPPLPGDRTLLVRLLDHLVGTALRLAARGGTVELAVRPAGADWLIEVTDPGPAAVGTPHPLAASFAAPGPAAQASRHGVGLGPVISRAIADWHRGTIRTTAGPAGGCTVQVRLPSGPAG